MANKMISEQELRDEFLSAMIRSEEPMKAPPDFSEEIMNRIGLNAEVSKVKPYEPPFWLKWGIPGVFLVCLIGLLLSGLAQEPAATEPVDSLFENASIILNSWLSGFKFDLQFPSLSFSETFLWILAGVTILTWSFVLLSHLLNKKAKQ